MRAMSGDWCRCGACGHVGYAYGTATSGRAAITAPWCQRCGINNQLEVLVDSEQQKEIERRRANTSHLVVGQCEHCFGINRHERNCPTGKGALSTHHLD